MAVAPTVIPSNQLMVFKKTILQTPPAPTYLTAADNVQTSPVFGLPAFSIVCGVRLQLKTEFQAFGLSSCLVTVGAVAGSTSNLNFYAPSFECAQTVTPTAFMYWSPLASFTTAVHDLTVTFTSVGALLNTLTAGELELTVLYRAL